MTFLSQSNIANPYVGPRAFQKGEILYGRDDEIEKLLNLLIAERIVLLHSPSGAGKTSLIQAALIPKLEEEKFQVLPVMRVSLKPHPNLVLPRDTNCYIFSLLLSLEEALPPSQRIATTDLACMKFVDYLMRLLTVTDESVTTTVFIFDQFEEILSIDPIDLNAKETFFAQLGEALLNRNWWALFAMREEYLPSLEPYLHLVPTRFNTTCRLNLLSKEAVIKPCKVLPGRRALNLWTMP